MKSVVIAAVAAAFSLAAGAASAEPVVAKLQAPLAKPAKLVAGGAVFVCEADTCTAVAPTADTETLTGCRELVRTVGPAATFGSSAKSLPAERLASCNKSARK
jgi:hypothetical protein